MGRKLTLHNVAAPGNPDFSGKMLLCPTCGIGLPINLTYKGKPYCTCNDCGLQLFFRGKLGIALLQASLSSTKFTSGYHNLGGDPLALVNKLEKLQEQKRQLEEKQGLIFKNQAIDDAIALVSKDISGIEKTLKKMAGREEIKK